MVAGASVDDGLICEAYLWALDNYRNEHRTRGFRPLTDEDFPVIYNLRIQLGREWSVIKLDRQPKDYYPWRHERLNQLQITENWSKETRDLYASIISTLMTWSRHGQNPKTKARLRILYLGASLLLQFLDRFPPQLVSKGKHDAQPL